MRRGTLFGALFELLVTLPMRVYITPLGADVKHVHWLQDKLSGDLLA